MRILFITASYIPTVNGVSYHISTVKEALEKKGHRVVVFAPTFPGYVDRDKDVVRYQSVPNPFLKKYPIGIPFGKLDSIKSLKPDIVHTHHPFIFGQLAAKVANMFDTPLFFTSHTRYQKYLDYYLPYASSIPKQIMKNNLKKLSEKCNSVVCPSIHVKNRLKKIGIHNTEVIFNGIEDSFFLRPERRDLSTPTIIFTGRIDKEKNPLFLIQTAKLIKKTVPNFKLLIVGTGKLLDKFYEEVFRNNLEKNVSIMGEIERDLLPNLYKTSHLFLTPSTSEVMPLSVIEAAACGLPIVALKNSNLDEIVQDEKNGYLAEPQPRDVANKIAHLFAHPNVLTEMAEASYEKAKEFSIKKTASNLEKLYKKSLYS